MFPDTYRVSPSNTSLFGERIAFLSLDRAGVTSSAPEYFKLTIGPMGSPSRSPPLNKLPKLKLRRQYRVWRKEWPPLKVAVWKLEANNQNSWTLIIVPYTVRITTIIFSQGCLDLKQQWFHYLKQGLNWELFWTA